MPASGSPRTFFPETLRHFGHQVLSTYGVAAPDAELLVDSLVAAELWGHTSHGMLRLPWYCARLASGAMKPECDPQILRDTGSLVLLDGRDGLGQSLAKRAVGISTERAEVHGVGAVGVRRANHFGTVAYFTRHAAEQGYACLMTANSSPAMAPWGGREKMLGSNPWSIAVPAGRHGVAVMDLSNTEVARGKVYAAHAQGEPIPNNWAAASDGVPTTDPARALEGLMLPMAGPKGYVITMMMDLLAGALTGAGMGSEITGPYSPEGSSNCGHLVISIKVDDMVGLSEFEDRVANYIDEIRSAPKASGVGRIYTPGELEDEHAAKTQASGIPLPARTVEQLNQLAASRGTEVL